MSVTKEALAYSHDAWGDRIVPVLHDFIRIPNVSPAYEPEWAELGHMTKAVELVRSWCAGRPIEAMTVDVQELDGRTPMIVVDVPAFGGGDPDDTVLLYGHLDKQPEMVGWRNGLGPWTPVVEGDRLYGRGGADDGYAAFASLSAIEAVQAAGGAHCRCLVLIEASEESGSPDLPAHLERLAERLGSPSLVLCLDSGCLDYERLWITTSLRGLVQLTLDVEILSEGVHSGEASGVVPSSFRIMRQLLDRIESSATGELLVAELHAQIPADRMAEAADTAAELSVPIAEHFPFIDGAGPAVEDAAEQLLARTWRPALSVVGVDGMAPAGSAGNVLRPHTALKLSLRLPPTCDAHVAFDALRARLLVDPPYGARVTLTDVAVGDGWNAPAFSPWLWDALEEASSTAFGSPARAFGEGGSIPFMGMLGQRFPDAQFVITGALGPGSNAHGPNEFLHLPTAERVTAALAAVLDAHARRHA